MFTPVRGVIWPVFEHILAIAGIDWRRSGCAENHAGAPASDGPRRPLIRPRMGWRRRPLVAPTPPFARRRSGHGARAAHAGLAGTGPTCSRRAITGHLGLRYLAIRHLVWDCFCHRGQNYSVGVSVGWLWPPLPLWVNNGSPEWITECPVLGEERKSIGGPKPSLRLPSTFHSMSGEARFLEVVPLCRTVWQPS